MIKFIKPIFRIPVINIGDHVNLQWSSVFNCPSMFNYEICDGCIMTFEEIKEYKNIKEFMNIESSLTRGRSLIIQKNFKRFDFLFSLIYHKIKLNNKEINEYQVAKKITTKFIENFNNKHLNDYYKTITMMFS